MHVKPAFLFLFKQIIAQELR